MERAPVLSGYDTGHQPPSSDVMTRPAPGDTGDGDHTLHHHQSTVYSELWVDFYSNLMATRGREIVTRMAAATLQRQDAIKCPETLS